MQKFLVYVKKERMKSWKTTNFHNLKKLCSGKKVKLFHIHDSTTLNCNLHFVFSNDIIFLFHWFIFFLSHAWTSKSLLLSEERSKKVNPESYVPRSSVKEPLKSQDDASHSYISKSHLSCVCSWMQIACYFHNIRSERKVYFILSQNQ